MIKVIMDSGKEYKIDWNVEELQEKCVVRTQVIVKPNLDFIEIKPGVFIHPQHISSIETIEGDKLRVSVF